MTLPTIDLDAATGAPTVVEDAGSTPATPGPLACAAGTKWEGDPREAPRPLGREALAKLDELATRELSEATRDQVAFMRGRIFFEAHRWDEAAALFREIAMHASAATGPYAAQLYLESLNVLGSHGAPACLGDMRRDVPALQRLYCGDAGAGTHGDLCHVLERLDLDIGRIESEKMPREAAAERYLALFKTHCASAPKNVAPDARTCAELLYNAAISFRAGGVPNRAADVLAQMRDPRYHLQNDPLTRRLACVLAVDGGTCP
jgi:hypothetical protein